MSLESTNQRSKVKKAIGKINNLIPLWEKLDGQDRKNMALLIEHEITSLVDHLRDTTTSPYVRLERLLRVKTKLNATAFDVGAVKALISQEVERIMAINGLQYEREGEEIATPTPKTIEAATDVDFAEDSASHVTRRYNVTCLKAGNKTLPLEKQKDHHELYFEASEQQYHLDSRYCLSAHIIHAFFHTRDESNILFMPIEDNVWWSLEMSSKEEATDFVVEFMDRYEGLFRASRSKHTKIVAYFKRT